MAQITWRNINNPDFTGGNRIIESGNQTMLSGLQQLANLGGKLESNQKTEQTEAATNEIGSLDRAGLTAALEGNQFGDLGNVDQSAINSALRGRDKSIDTEGDAKFARDEMLQGRANKPIMDSIKLALEKGNSKEATTLAGTLAGSGAQANALDSIEQDAYAKTDRTDKDKVRTDRLANEVDAKYIDQGVQESNRPLLELLSSDGNYEAYVQNKIEQFKTDRKGTADSAEIASYADQLRGILDVKFSKPTTDRIESELELDYEQIDQQQTELQSASDRLSVINSSGKVDVNGDTELESWGNFMGELEKSHGNESWMANFSIKDDGDTGGTELKTKMETLRQEGGYSTSMMRAAMRIHSQTAAEAFGDPDVYMTDVEQTLKEWTANKEGSKAMQVALEVVPIPTSNNSDDVTNYQMKLAQKVMELQGPGGKAEMNRLAKVADETAKKSANSIKRRKADTKRIKYAKWKQKQLDY